MRRLLVLLNVLALTTIAIASVAAIGLGWMPLQVAAAPAPAAEAKEADPQSKVAVFNIAAIMKDFKKAKYQIYLLNEQKKSLSTGLIQKREKYVKLEQKIRNETNKEKKEELTESQRDLFRDLQDEEQQISKTLNEKATEVISELYDDIKSVVDKIMETKGFDIIFAYPDASTPEELKSTYVKELKLKPPAAQPFAINKSIDLTAEITKELNKCYPSPEVPIGANTPMPNVSPMPGIKLKIGN